MLYKEWLLEWLAVCVRPTAKARTYEKYVCICKKRLAPKLGEYEIEMLSSGILQRFVADMSASLSPNTVNVVISVLKKSLKQAVLYGVAKRQYSDGIIRPKSEENRAECFTKDEQNKICYLSIQQNLSFCLPCAPLPPLALSPPLCSSFGL